VGRHFPTDRNAAILELGCGHGALLHVLRGTGYTNARGVDGSPEQVAAARRLGVAGVEQGDLLSALAATHNASLDVVVAFDVIEHFTKDELVALVDEVFRVLRPGGRWIIHAPNAEGPFGGRMRHWDFTHELAFTRASLTQLLMSSGFTRVACYEDRPVPHGVKSAVRAALWALIRAGLLLILAVETGAFQKAAIFSQNLLAVAERD
jgi:cyclopropane fatty-acyl-phospholipid synthase-like methyltransferase